VGKVDKGIKCSVQNCGKEALRSLAASKVAAAGLKIDTERRAYVCREHYKEYKKATKKDRTLERWRHQGSR
jgi:hypothetical protein